jgi:hypothetical protein
MIEHDRQRNGFREKLRCITLLVGIAALVFGSILSSRAVSMTTVIPPTEMVSAGGFRFEWRVQPPQLRVAPWHRAGIQIFEDGKPLPLRVESSDGIAAQGMGRFGAAPFSVGPAERDLIWFSASDNSNPKTNGKRYSLRVERGSPLIVVGFTVVSGLIVIALAVLELSRSILRHRPRRLRLSALFLLVATFFLSQSFTGRQLQVRRTLQNSRITYDSVGFAYRLPRWVPSHAFVEYGSLFDSGHPLRWVSSAAWGTGAAQGAFNVSSQQPLVVHFQTRDRSNPSLNGRSYAVSFPMCPQELAQIFWKLFLILAIAAFYLDPLGSAKSFNPRARIHVLRHWYNDTGWKWVLLAVALMKLWVAGKLEILTQPYDAIGYAASATSLVWGASDLPAGPAGFPMIAGLVSRFGVPWRFAVEFFYVGACFGLVSVMKKLFFSATAAVLVFSALVLHPWTLSGFNEFMPYPLLAILYVSLLGAMLHVLGTPSRAWRYTHFFPITALLFLWLWSRSENPLVYAGYLSFAAAAWLLSRREDEPAPARRRIVVLGVPLASAILMSAAVQLTNYWVFGSYSHSVTSEPALLRLMSTLYRVRPEKQIPFAPVTRNSLSMASRVSPALRPFHDELMDPSNGKFGGGEALTATPGEFGPWLNFVLIKSLPGNRPEANRVMREAAAEIDAAIASGVLPRRSAFFPFDPNWKRWVPELFPSFLQSLGAGMSLARWEQWPTTNQRWAGLLFDQAADRKAKNVFPRRIELSNSSLVTIPIDPKDSETQKELSIWELRSELLIKIFLVAAVLVVFVGSLNGKTHASQAVVGWSLLLAIALFVERAALVAVLQANVAWGIDRYMRLISPLWVPIIVLFAAAAGLHIASRRRRNAHSPLIAAGGLESR